MQGVKFDERYCWNSTRAANSADGAHSARRSRRSASDGVQGLHVIADETVSRGGCRVHTEFGVIDQQIESQLMRIETELQ